MATKLRTKQTLFFTALLAISFSCWSCAEKKPAAPTVIPYKEASKHIGEVQTVEGTIVSTHRGKKVLKLNFNPNYRRYLSITIPLAVVENFPDNPQSHYKGKKIHVTGRITKYGGVPSMFVTDGPQIRVVDGREQKAPPAAIEPVLNRDYLRKATAIIDGAEKTIHIIMYVYKYGRVVKKIYAALKRAEERGVEVEILMDDDVASNSESAPYLENVGVDVKIDGPQKKTHCKIIIADSRKTLLGSTNFSNSSIGRNNETNVYIDSEAVAAYYEDYFKKLWEDPSREPFLEAKPVVDGVIPLVNREYLWSLLPRLNNAGKRIWVVMYATKLSEDPDTPVNMVLSSLVGAKKRGVDVRVCLDMGPEEEWARMTTEFNKEVSDYLHQRGVPVRFDSPEVITHAKLVIVDDVAFVGSTNWGHGGLKRYNSTNAIISDREAVEAYEKYFLNLWDGKPYGIEQDKPEEKEAA